MSKTKKTLNVFETPILAATVNHLEIPIEGIVLGEELAPIWTAQEGDSREVGMAHTFKRLPGQGDETPLSAQLGKAGPYPVVGLRIVESEKRPAIRDSESVTFHVRVVRVKFEMAESAWPEIKSANPKIAERARKAYGAVLAGKGWLMPAKGDKGFPVTPFVKITLPASFVEAKKIQNGTYLKLGNVSDNEEAPGFVMATQLLRVEAPPEKKAHLGVPIGEILGKDLKSMVAGFFTP